MNEITRNALISAGFYLFVFGVLILISRIFKSKTTKDDLGLKGWLTWKDILVAIVGFIIYLLLAALLTSFFSVFPNFDADQIQNVGFDNVYGAKALILAFISLVIVAPIAEELIFRGFVYGKLKKNLKISPVQDIIIATLLTSLLFAFLHGQANVGINVFAMSIVMCLMREFTGTIYSGILLHMIKNAIAFYLLYLVL